MSALFQKLFGVFSKRRQAPTAVAPQVLLTPEKIAERLHHRTSRQQSPAAGPLLETPCAAVAANEPGTLSSRPKSIPADVPNQGAQRCAEEPSTEVALQAVKAVKIADSKVNLPASAVPSETDPTLIATDVPYQGEQRCADGPPSEVALHSVEAVEIADDDVSLPAPVISSEPNLTPIATDETSGRDEKADHFPLATPAVNQRAIQLAPEAHPSAEILGEFHAFVRNPISREEAETDDTGPNILKILKLDLDESIRTTFTALPLNPEVLAAPLLEDATVVSEEFREPESITERIVIADEMTAPISWKVRTVGEVMLEGECSVRLSNCIAANQDFFCGWTVGKALANRSEFASALMNVRNLGRKTANEALDALNAFALHLTVKEDGLPITDPLSGFDPAEFDASIRTVLGSRHVSVRLTNLLATGALDDLKVRDFFLQPDRVRARMTGCKNAGKKTVTEAFELLTAHVEALGLPDADSVVVQTEDEVPEGLTTREWIEQEIAALPPNRVEVLHSRYGLDGDAPQTLQEIAERVHVTRQRVSQVEGKALTRLRANTKSRAAFKRYLDEERNAQWVTLFGPQSLLPENEVQARLRKLDPWFLLAIDIVFNNGIVGYLGASAHKTSAGWFRSAEEAEDWQKLDRLLGDVLSNYQTPMPLDTLQEIAPSVIGSISGEDDLWAVYDGYIFTGHIGSKARRTGRMHAVARRIAQSGIFDIGTLIIEYRSEFPDDDCGSRMFEMQASEATHLFAPLFDGIWLCLANNFQQVDCLSVPPFERRRVEETHFADGSLGDMLVKQLAQFGAQRMIDLRRKIIDHGQGAFSESSVGAVLISNPCFRRVAPGIFGLYTGTSEVPAAIDDHLLEDRHCRLYCHARHSGSPQDYYPMWGAAYEMRLAYWAKRHAPPDLYRSLMAVIQPGVWPAAPEIIAEFEALRWRDGQWQLGASRRVPFGHRFLDAGQFFSILTHLVVFNWISWVGVNRVTGSKSDNHDAADVLAFLVMTGLVEPELDWQARHRPTNLAKRLFLEARRERHLHGDAPPRGEDVFSRLKNDLYDAPPTASRGWVNAEEYRQAMPAWRADGISTGKAFAGSQARQSGINAEGSFETDDWGAVFGG
ncbi:hypothetical protein MKK58_08740 [Methylobacterium sp. J-078]|uniref:sigma factor-like helix-turn-helix DNA-binding protein n=1 Tax=Methylobacterium sp. J-078 TaxID=2836657 RepID=UPI001FB9B784|nr:sigma factor-like helix-turn-helix DNA-binding protein [Methylobacterium sp. J-078]MCJ2044614.1 hypothetical protein [Methylobacterium sp. J-078]